MAKKVKGSSTSFDSATLVDLLEERFKKNMQRHKGLDFEKLKAKLLANPGKLGILHQMEKTGGEPDVIAYDKKSDEFIIVDCSAESPAGRRSLCYDREALNSRKEYKPADSAIDMARAIGIEMLDENLYRQLQSVGTFDSKTSSWLKTPSDIRKLDGAIFGDFRYGHVFIYHNGASSYYAARGFRGVVRV